MKKHFKIVAIFASILVCIMFITSPMFSLRDVTHIEQEEVKEDTLQARNILEADVQHLFTTAGDYAGWDDAYDFMEQSNPKFIASSLGEAFYSKLRLNFFCMIDNDGRILFIRAHDYINNVHLPVQPSLLHHLKHGSPLLNHASPESVVSGFVSLPEGLMMIVSRPILTTEYKGPPRGNLVIGRFIDPREASHLSNMLKYEIEFINFASNSKEPVFLDQLSHFTKTDDVLTQKLSDERIAGYVQLQDIYGQVAGLVKLEKTRGIYRHAKQNAQVMMIIYCLVCLDVLFIVMLLRKKLAIVKLNKQEVTEQLHSFIELAIDGVFNITRNGKIFLVNSSVCEMTGYTRDELMSMRFSQLFKACEAGELMLGEQLQQYHNKTTECTLLSKDGQQIEVELTCKKMPDYNFQGVIHDISAYKALERELMKYRNRISRMSIEVSVAEERERNRIAGELHDQVGPTLMLGKLKIDQLQARLPDAEYEDELEAAKKFINRSIQDIRTLTFQLRPPILANAGLEAALKWLAQDFESQYGIQVSVQHDGTPILLEYGLRLTLFQAAREFLLNIVKHAKARHVVIAISNDSGVVTLTVEDDGVGFLVPQDYGTNSNSFGLFNSQQRIIYHGGTMQIDSSPGHGTRVLITIPLNTEHQPISTSERN